MFTFTKPNCPVKLWLIGLPLVEWCFLCWGNGEELLSPKQLCVVVVVKRVLKQAWLLIWGLGIVWLISVVFVNFGLHAESAAWLTVNVIYFSFGSTVVFLMSIFYLTGASPFSLSESHYILHYSEHGSPFMQELHVFNAVLGELSVKGTIFRFVCVKDQYCFFSIWFINFMDCFTQLKGVSKPFTRE